VLDANVKAITGQVEQFFKNGAEYARQSEHKSTKSAPDEKAPVKVVNNLDWHGGIGFLQFLREVGKLARMSTMLSRDA
jgi:tyrosyl-tRNA synthetase